ncbi:MAG: T9SS type A sorting domain-containing protein, partial [candidate division WOR-3 bacterium]
VYTNQPLPDPTSSNPHSMICVNWDDLYPPYGNRIWYLYEPDSHRFIIEWDSVHYFSPNTQWDKFEIIVYDTTVPTPTGDNKIVFQYYTANNYTSNTVGIENNTSTRGICGLYNGTYHRAQAPLVSGRAVSFVTGEPVIGITDFSFKSRERKSEIYPTLLFGFRLNSLILEKEEEVTVYDATGKIVAEKGKGRSGVIERLPAGIYFLKKEGRKKEIGYKIVILR